LSFASNLQGNYTAAIEHADWAIQTYDPAYQPPSFDTKVQAIAECVPSCWTLGYPDRAKKRALEAIEQGERISHVPAIAMAVSVTTTLCWLSMEWHEVGMYAERLTAFTSDKDLPYWRAWGQCFRGAALAALGKPREGCPMMRAAMVELDLQSENMVLPIHTHGKAWLHVMEADAGLSPVEAAIRFVQEAIDDAIESGVNRGARLVLPHDGEAAAQGRRREAQSQHASGGGKILSEGNRNGAIAVGQIIRTARLDRTRAPVGAAKQDRRRAQDAVVHLRLVQGGPGHARPQGCKGAARITAFDSTCRRRSLACVYRAAGTGPVTALITY
jgi:hypothetical protein